MHRINFDSAPGSAAFSPPEMTVYEAAEAMERNHARQLLVGRGGTPLGVVTEEDIVSKVLAAGLDPNQVHVEDVMNVGRLDGHGAFLLEEDHEHVAPIWGAMPVSAPEEEDAEPLVELLSGKCEECSVYSDELRDQAGLLLCNDCSGFRQSLFG